MTFYHRRQTVEFTWQGFTAHSQSRPVHWPKFHPARLVTFWPSPFKQLHFQNMPGTATGNFHSGSQKFPPLSVQFPKIPVMKIPLYIPCVSINLSKLSFLEWSNWWFEF